jgi:Zn-dependent oligopeptidase
LPNIIQKMQQTVDAFIKLNSEADQSVGAIAEKLAETWAKFKDDMMKHDREFHKLHADTLQIVAETIQPLANTTADFKK